MVIFCPYFVNTDSLAKTASKIPFKSNENGFFIDNTATSSTANPIQNIPAGIGGMINIDMNPPNKYVVIAHTHDASGPTGQGTYSIFSWNDLTAINNLAQQNHLDISKFIFYLISADGTRYALTINDISDLNYFFYNPNPNDIGQTVDMDRLTIMQEKFEKYYDESKGGLITETSNPADDKINFLKFLKESGLNAAISLFEVDPTFTTYTQLTLSSSGTIIPKNCN